MNKNKRRTNFHDFKNELVSNDKELQKNLEDIKVKYLIIKELIIYKNKNNLSQKQLGDKLGFTQQYVSKIIKGITIPTIVKAAQILRILGKKIEIQNENHTIRLNNIENALRKRNIPLNEKAPVQATFSSTLSYTNAPQGGFVLCK